MMTRPRLAWSEIAVPVELAEVVDEISYQRVVMNAGSHLGLLSGPLRPALRRKPRPSQYFHQHDAPRGVHRPDRDRLGGPYCRVVRRKVSLVGSVYAGDSMVGRGRVVNKRCDDSGETPRYFVDLEISVFNQHDELCCPAEVTLELSG